MTAKSRLICSLPRFRHNRRTLWRSLAIGLMLLAPLPAFAVDYLSAVDDLPLATGLTEQKDKTTVFDAPVGKLVARLEGAGTSLEDWAVVVRCDGEARGAAARPDASIPWTRVARELAD